MFRRYLSLAVCLGLAAATLSAQSTQKNQNKEQERLAEAAVVMNEILDVPDNVPQDILDKAECIIVIPSMTKVALGVGGSYGRGAMVCRTGQSFDGPWGAPANASASTDATLRAEILSYSRTRGLFVGVSLEGASLRPDNDASEQVYGRRISAHTIVTSTGISVPAAGRRFVDALEKNPPRNESQKVTRNEQ